MVIDFIDMSNRKNRASLERHMREVVKIDKARVEVGTLSKFGLLEMSRQRLRAALSTQSHITCSHCHGAGLVRNPELVALEVLRKIQLATLTGQVTRIRAHTSPAVALFLLNSKKGELVALEQKHSVAIIIVADGRLGHDQYEFEIERLQNGSIALQRSTQKPVLARAVVPEEEEEDRDDDSPRTLIDDEPEPAPIFDDEGDPADGEDEGSLSSERNDGEEPFSDDDENGPIKES